MLGHLSIYLLFRLCTLEDTKITTLHYCHMICPFIEVFRAAYLIWHSVPTLANFYLCLRRLGERVRSREEIFTNVTWMFVSVVLVQMGALVSVLVLLSCKYFFFRIAFRNVHMYFGFAMILEPCAKIGMYSVN